MFEVLGKDPEKNAEMDLKSRKRSSAGMEPEDSPWMDLEEWKKCRAGMNLRIV